MHSRALVVLIAAALSGIVNAATTTLSPTVPADILLYLTLPVQVGPLHPDLRYIGFNCYTAVFDDQTAAQVSQGLYPGASDPYQYVASLSPKTQSSPGAGVNPTLSSSEDFDLVLQVDTAEIAAAVKARNASGSTAPLGIVVACHYIVVDPSGPQVPGQYVLGQVRPSASPEIADSTNWMYVDPAPPKVIGAPTIAPFCKGGLYGPVSFAECVSYPVP